MPILNEEDDYKCIQCGSDRLACTCPKCKALICACSPCPCEEK